MAPRAPRASDPAHYDTPRTDRPYRVGMARPQQRYIEPDVIYTDMARGERARIPRQFPFSWNPVNGFTPTGDFTSQNTARARSSQGYGDASEFARDSVGPNAALVRTSFGDQFPREFHPGGENGSVHTDIRHGSQERWGPDDRRSIGAVYARNGVGSTASDLFSNIVDKVTDTGTKTAKDIADDTTKSAEDHVSQGVEDLLKGTAGQAFLDAVEKRATQGVTDVVKENAPNLIMLAVAGGAVGGALSAKLGKTGTVLSLLVAGWAGYKLLNAKVPVKK